MIQSNRKKYGLYNEDDVRFFFKLYDEKKFEEIFDKYMSSNCVWRAMEKTLNRKKEIINYWSVTHNFFIETLCKPESVIITDREIYLQVNIKLDFTADGNFCHQHFYKGDVYNFRCCDYYKLDEDHKIAEGIIYSKH